LKRWPHRSRPSRRHRGRKLPRSSARRRWTSSRRTSPTGPRTRNSWSCSATT